MKPASTDLVVVLPGILGSTLRREGHLVWAPSAARCCGHSVPFSIQSRSCRSVRGIGDDHPVMAWNPLASCPIGISCLVSGPRSKDTTPAGQAPRAGLSRGRSRCTTRRPANLLPVPYDWRLSNRHNGQRLKSIVEPALERWRAHSGTRTPSLSSSAIRWAAWWRAGTSNNAAVRN